LKPTSNHQCNRRNQKGFHVRKLSLGNVVFIPLDDGIDPIDPY
jgi:hypothetical protein